MTAFSYLNNLDKRFAGESGSVIVNSASVERTLHIKVDRYDLLLPLDNSTEVISQISYSPLPISRPWILGIASRRGQLLTLIDIKNYLFNSDPVNKIGNRRVVASKVNGVFLGLIVDHAVGLMNLQKDSFENAYPEYWDSTLVNCLSGVYKEGDTYYGVCDLQKMLNDKHFTEGQKQHS